MPLAAVNGTQLFYNLTGAGEIPLVLVHGSWVSHQSWDLVHAQLVKLFRVVTYDRRGHSDSPPTIGQGSVREDVADLAALIEHLRLAPAWVVGNSFGASIALRLASERPELFRGLIVHEPPLFSLLADETSMIPMLEEVGRRVDDVAHRIAAGDNAGAAEQFIETVALGRGAWSQLAPEFKRILITNAATFLDEARDPEQLRIDVEPLGAFDRPALLTIGDQSPPLFREVVRKLQPVLPKTIRITGAGHIPHVTHPDRYVQLVASFIRETRRGQA
jgi:pimeloyl-ACP methyl ester carboxylesterase